MAKKNKKRSTSSSARVVKNPDVTTPTVAATAAATTSSKGAAAYGSSEFNPDYSYVKKDLKRIGTLAGSFFVILVVLSFFLR